MGKLKCSYIEVLLRATLTYPAKPVNTMFLCKIVKTEGEKITECQTSFSASPNGISETIR